MTGVPPRPLSARWRDSLLFLSGLGLIVWEAVGRDSEPRMPMLVLYASMVGLAPFLRADEKRTQRETDTARVDTATTEPDTP